MPWFLTGHGSLCLEEDQKRAHWGMKLFTFSRQVCTSCHLIGQPPSLKTEHIEIPKHVNAVKPSEKTRSDPMKDDNQLEQQLSAMLATQTERDQRLAQLTEELALKSALLEAAEATKGAGLEPREFADWRLAQTPLVERKDAELVKMQTKLDELVLSRDRHVRALEQALQKATSRAADADEYEIELAKVRTELEARKSELEARKSELEARKSELETIRSRLTDAEIGWAKSKTEADRLRALNTTSLASTDEDRIARRPLDRMRTMEGEMASLRWSEKILKAMEARNKG